MFIETVTNIIQKWKKHRHKDITKEWKNNNGIELPEQLYKYNNIKKEPAEDLKHSLGSSVIKEDIYIKLINLYGHFLSLLLIVIRRLMESDSLNILLV